MRPYPLNLKELLVNPKSKEIFQEPVALGNILYEKQHLVNLLPQVNAARSIRPERGDPILGLLHDIKPQGGPLTEACLDAMVIQSLKDLVKASHRANDVPLPNSTERANTVAAFDHFSADQQKVVLELPPV